MAHSEVRIGCSGWNYRHWRGRFYPQGLAVKGWFDFYAAHFDTVEVNNSFYRLPQPATVEAWRDQAPPGFRYAMKANRFLTQAKKLKDCEEPLGRMLPVFRHLDDKLGPILYQLPPGLKRNDDRLESFLRLLPSDLNHVFEFRDASWYDDAVFALLARYDATLCVHDMPGSISPRRAIGPIVYVRFHGCGAKYRGRYPDAALQDWCDWIAAQAERGRIGWVYFNNDIDADAIADAQTLKAMVRQSLR